MRVAQGALMLLAALGCAGCELAPDYKPPTVALPAAYKENSKWSEARPSDHLPRGPWWTAFKDKTLNALEPQVDEANQSLEVAVANYQQARAGIAQAEAGLFPTLDQYSQLTTNRQS